MRTVSLLALLLALVAPTAAGFADPPPDGPFALTNARLQTVTGGVIEDATLVIEDGRIAAMGPDVAPPDDARVIDCAGLTVYPGLIDSGTRLGLAEVGSMAETRDFNEIGQIAPHMKALTAVNPSSVHIPVTRVAGVTTALAAPSGGLFPGTAALINLHGYTPEQMQVADVEAVMVEFPRGGKRSPWGDRPNKKIRKQKRKKMEKLNETWEQAQLYARIDSAYRADPEGRREPQYKPAMQALVPVVRGERPLIIKTNAAPDIRAALDWAEERDLTENIILSGAREGWRVADRLAELDVPCLVGPVLSTPTRDADRYDKPYANPGLLAAAGVDVALRTGEAENVRNLPYHAGFAATYGMSREDALRAITIAPARIFGVAGRLGSLEEGKQATLFVADGDPFQTQTSVEHVFIDGYKIPMTNRQIRLYEEYRNRDPGLREHPSRESSAETTN
jgi:imidazolonepropionase-like amidohydrolase